MNDFKITLQIESEDYHSLSLNELHYEFSKQYERDSFLYKEDKSFLLFIGVCFNKDTFGTEKEKNWPVCAFQSFKNNKKSFLEKMNGYFAGAFFDYEAKEFLLFVDHLSTIPIYYYQTKKAVIIDTDLFRLASELRKRDISIRLSEFGAYSMMAYGFMLDNHTLLDGVFKVRPASMYSCCQEKDEKYFEYYAENKEDTVPAEEIVEGIDGLFHQAITNLFSADASIKHLVTLSGGLDSRMCLLYALKCGYKNITTLNYSQSFYIEELVAKKIAADFGCEHIFISLDNGNYLSNIDEGIRATYGMTTYRPILSTRMIWKQLQMNLFGFVHSGLLGDTILGGYCIDKCNEDNRFHSPLDFALQLNAKNKTILSAQYRDVFLPFFYKIHDWIPSQKMASIGSEKYVVDNRYINGLIQSSLGTRGISVLSSPYIDKAFMKYVYRFPSHMRKNHNLYFKWMKKCMSAALDYKWENTLLKPVYWGIDFKPHDKKVELFKKMDFLIHPRRPERSRNPYGYWMKHNSNIQKELIDYCAERMELTAGYKELYDISRQTLEYNNIYLLIRLATLLGFFDMTQ